MKKVPTKRLISVAVAGNIQVLVVKITISERMIQITIEQIEMFQAMLQIREEANLLQTAIVGAINTTNHKTEPCRRLLGTQSQRS